MDGQNCPILGKIKRPFGNKYSGSGHLIINQYVVHHSLKVNDKDLNISHFTKGQMISRADTFVLFDWALNGSSIKAINPRVNGSKTAAAGVSIIKLPSDKTSCPTCFIELLGVYKSRYP